MEDQKSKQELFNTLKQQLLNIDPVAFCEQYLTLDGKPFRLTGNGYKPLADIYRYIGVKALEPTAKPLIIVKGRQIGMTTAASALEMYFMCSGLFGVGDKPPIRVMHTFPFLELAAAYSKTKLSQLMNGSKTVMEKDAKKGIKPKSYIMSLLDTSTPTNNSLTFKQFVGGNHLWIESVGLDGDRIMGRTCDVIFCDECFPASQKISTNKGKRTIRSLYYDFISGKPTPLIYSFNVNKETFEYKPITHAWRHKNRKLIEVICSGKKIKCTPNHKFLTNNGWKEASALLPGNLIKSAIDTDHYIRSVNDDQKQIILGSFLGDGHISQYDLSRFRLSVIHGNDQSDYCKWKADMFGVKAQTVNKNGYAQKSATKFCTRLFGLEKQFPKTKTICPQWVLDDIDIRGIAIWFMDDGSVRRWNNGSSATLSTCSFDEDSQKRFVKKFKTIGIDCKYKKYSDYYHLVFNKNEFKKLSQLIAPYAHPNIYYKFNKQDLGDKYIWNNKQNSYCWNIVDKINNIEEHKTVYDIEISDNHNFVLAPNKHGKSICGPIAHNCQRTTDQAIGNSLKILTTAKYGNKGVQVFFGTPRRKGSGFYKRWVRSSQQYYHLGCEKCQQHFPLYTPGSDEWEKIWITGYIVKCTHCGFEQDKREAAERGKWIALKSEDDADCDMVGFHLNQLYMPFFTKEDLMKEKPGIHPVNTERVYYNEVLGEFFQGDASPITPEEIREHCSDVQRKFRANITPGEEQIVVLGIDYGLRADLEQMANPETTKVAGQSYSTAVVMVAKGPGLLSVEFATKFKRNDMESKKGLIDQLMRQYSVQLAVGDIGYSNDFSAILHNEYGDKYLVSRAHNKINNHVKFSKDAFPKEIIFERDYYIGELFEQMKKGMIRFPFGDFEKVAWLIDHCSSMEIKPSISRGGDPSIHYVKGTTPNDGFMALLNAYIAYKFIATKGFESNNPMNIEQNMKNKNKPLAILGNISRRI